VGYTPSRSGILVHNLSSTSAAKSTFLLSLSTTKLNKIPRRPPMLVKPLGVSGSTGSMKAANGSTCSKIRMRSSNTYDQKTLASHKLMHWRERGTRESPCLEGRALHLAQQSRMVERLLIPSSMVRVRAVISFSRLPEAATGFSGASLAIDILNKKEYQGLTIALDEHPLTITVCHSCFRL
jgi:hypothetical protein